MSTSASTASRLEAFFRDEPGVLSAYLFGSVAEGRRVYCADVREDREFVRVVQSRAADLEPFLRRMRCLKLETLRR